MSIQSVGYKAYSEALQHFNRVDGSLKQGQALSRKNLFAQTLDQTLIRDSVDKGESFGAQADFIRYPDQLHVPVVPRNGFLETVSDSLNRVNELQKAKEFLTKYKLDGYHKDQLFWLGTQIVVHQSYGLSET